MPFRLPDEPIVPTLGTQLQGLNLQQAMIQAAQLQAQGRLQAAETLLRQVLQAYPNHAHALHLLGVVAHQSGQAELAIELINKAIAINDKPPLFHANLGEMYRQRGNLDDAVRHGEKAVALEPKMASAHSNLGIAYFDLEDFERAKACQQRALKLDPNLPTALNNMGSILREEKQIQQAMAFYHRAIAANPNYIEPLNNLGLTLIEENRAEEAIMPLSNAVQQDPNYSDAQCNLGAAYSMLDQHEKAFPCYKAALAQRPDFAQAHVGIARIYQEKDDLIAAEAAVLRAIEIEPEDAGANSVLANIYLDKGMPAEAERYFNEALSLDEESLIAHLGKGHMHMEAGEFEAAEACFKRALALDQENYGPRYSLTQTKKVCETDENFMTLRKRRDIGSLQVREAIPFHYALGKCYDDTGEYERAFEHYLEGARLKRSTISYDTDNYEQVISRLIDVFDDDGIARLRGGGDVSELPIFILGMPRSGTTLTEQIIASHPVVHGAGELRDLKDLAHRHFAPSGKSSFPNNLRDLTPGILSALGTEYINGLRKRTADVARITDKMPGNFQFIGLIHVMLPNAKIIHVKRNPLDTCISCFSRLFRHNQYQSYDLYEQGLFYRDYDRMMKHWRKALPADAFYEIQYEDLVKDTEAEARRLIDFCGLDWNDACLKFYSTRRSVRTASITQVRQPIYTSSVERWRRYEKFLGPLQKALGNLIL